MDKKKWPPTKAYIEELERKALTYDKLRDKNMVHELAEEFCKALGTTFAHTPYDKWPDIVKECFKHAASVRPLSRDIYLKNLPTS